MKKIFFCVFCFLLFGVFACGKKKENIEYINQEELMEDGYKEISGIAYVKVEREEEKPSVHIAYCNDEPELAVYFMGSMMEAYDFNCDFSVFWKGKEYTFDDESCKDFTEENVIEAFPKDWKNALKKVQEGGLGNIVSKSVADVIDSDVEDLIEIQGENDEEKENEEKSLVSKKEYEIDGEKFLIAFFGDESDFEIYISAIAKTEEKAALILTTIDSLFKESVDEYSININCMDYNVSYMKNKEKTIVTGTNKDGTASTSMPDWLPSELTMPEQEMTEYNSEIKNAIKDFFEKMDER